MPAPVGTTRTPVATRPRLLAAVAGVASALVGLGVAELAAGLIATGAGPVIAIGGTLIDLAPGWAKQTAIALFGTGDKAALLVGIAVVATLVAAVAGLAERARPPIGRLIVAIAGLAGVVAVGLRPGSDLLALLPTAAGAVLAMIALGVLVPRLPELAPAEVPVGVSRRGFLSWAGGAAAIGALAAVGGYALQAGSRAASAIRDTLRLPAPAIPAPPIPAAAELDVPGISPLITPNPDFYRIDIDLIPPRVDVRSWRLRIRGMVDQEVELGWDDVTALPLQETVATLMCGSNYVGGDLVSTARWLGYPIRELLARAGPRADADMVLSRGPDGFTASTPLDVLLDPDRDALLAIGMNGEPLPVEHGFPARLVVPGLYGYVSATKWVTELEVTRFDQASAYWTNHGWAPRGPVKLSSRIDVPRTGAQVAAGDVVVAGVAWHQHVGVGAVELQVDDGEWLPAELAEAVNTDTWRQWRTTWAATPGEHTLRVRAIGADGEVQDPVPRDVVPDGATGLHERRVSVG